MGITMVPAKQPALRQWPGGAVAGWIPIAVHCSAVTAYAQCSQPERDTVVSLHALSNKQPSGEWGDGQAKCARERKGAKPSINGNISQKRNVLKKGNRGRKDVRKDRRAERAEGEKRPVMMPVPIFLSRRGSKLKKKKAKTQVLGILWAHAFTALVMVVPRATSNVCLRKANLSPLFS